MGQHRIAENQIKVRDFLRGSGVRVGERLPGERELATRLGIGRAALRSVLDSLEEEGVIQRQPQSGTTLMSIPAPAVQSARVFLIGPFQGGCDPERVRDASWLYRVVSAFERMAAPAGVTIILKDQSPYICDPCSIKSLVHEAVDEGAHAAVLLHPAGPHYKIACALGMLHDRDIQPIIVSSSTYPGLASQVYFDAGWGAYIATRHLFQNGHQRIAFVGGPADRDWIQERVAGYRDAAEALGIPPELRREWLIEPCGDIAPDRCGPDIISQWRSLPDDLRPTAIVAGRDSIALSIIEAARKAGIDVPCDLSIVGFDNEPSALLAGLTTVERPTEALGEAVARVTLERLAGGIDAPAVTLRLKPILIQRSSVASLC
jgi:DNA-binding LacI/PurR family transcriptional regulator/biotin operon repressor